MLKLRSIVVVVIFSMLFVAVGGNVCAQGNSRQAQKSKKDKKKERKRWKYEGGYDNTEDATAINTGGEVVGKEGAQGKRKHELRYPSSRVKKRYRVGLVLPLYLDELVHGDFITFKGEIPDKAMPGLLFYQGVKMATDSLRRAGVKMDLYVYDAGSVAESPEMLVVNHQLDSADLIVGAVEQHDIFALANFAKKKKINFISALTNNDGLVKNNQFFTMLQPSVKSHCEFIIDDLSGKYAGQNVTLLYRTFSLADDNAALYILNDLYSDVTFRKLLCNALPDKAALARMFDTSKPNIVVVSILELAFADSILHSLAKYFPGTHFEVYGMPTWGELQGLRKATSYRNLTINISYPFNFGSADGALQQAIERQYKEEFGGHTSEMVMRGYETILWYGTLLWQYGTIFNNNYKEGSSAPFTKYKIKPRWDRNGSLLYLENKHIYMSTYQGGIYSTR